MDRVKGETIFSLEHSETWKHHFPILKTLEKNEFII